MATHRLRRLAQKIQHDLYDLWYTLVSSSVYETQVGGVSAQYKCSSWREQYRATELMSEKSVLIDLLAYLNEDDVFWDIGAAVGTYTCLVGQIADETVAFEPVQSNYQRLQENVRLNNITSDVTICATGLSDRNGIRPFDVQTDEPGRGTHKINSDSELLLPMFRGDSLELPAPDIVKIDVEGHETYVLKGLQDHLRSVNYVLVEMHDGTDINVIKQQLSEFEVKMIGGSDVRGEAYVIARADDST